MTLHFKRPLLLAVLLTGGIAAAHAQHEEHGGGDRAAGHEGGDRAAGHEGGDRAAGHEGGQVHPAPESHEGPRGYQRVEEPHGWNQRPAQPDRSAYQHNFQAARAYHVGPYHRPPGWTARRWVYGDILPRAFWSPQYLLADYWLFALEVPPVGYEWVRSGADALLVNTGSGEILQVEYGVFA